MNKKFVGSLMLVLLAGVSCKKGDSPEVVINHPPHTDWQPSETNKKENFVFVKKDTYVNKVQLTAGPIQTDESFEIYEDVEQEKKRVKQILKIRFNNREITYTAQYLFFRNKNGYKEFTDFKDELVKENLIFEDGSEIRHLDLYPHSLLQEKYDYFSLSRCRKAREWKSLVLMSNEQNYMSFELNGLVRPLAMHGHNPIYVEVKKDLSSIENVFLYRLDLSSPNYDNLFVIDNDANGEEVKLMVVNGHNRRFGKISADTLFQAKQSEHYRACLNVYGALNDTYVNLIVDDYEKDPMRIMNVSSHVSYVKGPELDSTIISNLKELEGVDLDFNALKESDDYSSNVLGEVQ